MQDSKDLELKTTFRECPLSLEVFKIRSLGAHDAMASELKYHQKCWIKIILNRIKEVLYTLLYPWRHLQHVFSVTMSHLPRRLQDLQEVVKTCLQGIFQRRLQDVLTRRLPKTPSRCLGRREIVMLKTSSRRMFAGIYNNAIFTYKRSEWSTCKEIASARICSFFNIESIGSIG